MPVTVVVGGQFGSEGKGKVAHWLAREREAACAVRVGGSNSGHTVVEADGTRHVFRHLPTAAVLPDIRCFLGAGSYIDPEVFLKEVESVDLSHNRILVDPEASVITEEHKRRERNSGLRREIGSTLSGTGAAVQDRISRDESFVRAGDHPALAPFVSSVAESLRDSLEAGERVILEGTQGYGLSLIHSEHYPYVTSRDTTAASFLAEAGLSPRDADEIVLVLRAFPIRVGGSSGPLPREIDWETVTRASGTPRDLLQEHTSVSGSLRRVARFDSRVVEEAIRVNQPTEIVINHLDYVDWQCRVKGGATPPVVEFLKEIEGLLGRRVDHFGFGPRRDQMREAVPALKASQATVDNRPAHVRRG